MTDKNTGQITAVDQYAKGLADGREAAGLDREDAYAAGSVKAFRYMESHNRLAMHVVLYRVKRAKEYKSVGMTWAEFCDSVGLNSRTVDKTLADLRPIIDEFSAESAELLGVEFNRIRFLGRQIGDGAAEVTDDGAIMADGQRIELSPENKGDIEALIDALKDEHRQSRERLESEVRAKSKAVESREQTINKYEKRLAKLEQQAETAGYESPEEQEILRQIENIRIGFDGYLARLDRYTDPDILMDATPRHLASALAAIEYMKNMIVARWVDAQDYAKKAPGEDIEWSPIFVGDDDAPEE